MLAIYNPFSYITNRVSTEFKEHKPLQLVLKHSCILDLLCIDHIQCQTKLVKQYWVHRAQSKSEDILLCIYFGYTIR